MTKAKTKPVASLRLPSPDEWDELSDWIERTPELAPSSRPAIETAVRKAIALFEKIMRENNEMPDRKSTLSKAKRIQGLLTKLEHELHGQSSQHQLRAIKADEQLADLLSFSAVQEVFETSDLARPIERNEFSAFVSKSEFVREVPSLARFDRHFVKYRKEAIADDTGRMMLHAVRRLRLPIDEWLFAARQHKGSRPHNTARRALLFELIMGYEAIFETRITPDCKRHLISLATHLFPRCGLDDEGLEESVSRALDDFMPIWAVLSLAPETSSVGSVRGGPDHDLVEPAPAQPSRKK